MSFPPPPVSSKVPTAVSEHKRPTVLHNDALKLHEREEESFRGLIDAKVTFLCFCPPEENLVLQFE